MGRVFGYREIEIDPDANFFEEEFPDLVVESVSVSDEEAMILESELAKVLEENKLTSFPSIPFCGYVDTQLVYKASTGKVFSFELLACRPYFVVGVTFEEDEMNADKLECCVANDVIYSILLKKCRPGSEKQVHRIKNE